MGNTPSAMLKKGENLSNPDAGNAAAMREALERITRMTDTNPGHLSPIAILTQIGEVAEAALAAPARNCDVIPADEWKRNFDRFCKRFEHCHNCPIHGKWNFANGMKPSCIALWAVMTCEKAIDYAPDNSRQNHQEEP